VDRGHGVAGGTIGLVAGGVGGFLLLMLVVVAGIRFALGRRRSERGGRAVLPLASMAFPDVSPPSEPSRVARSRTEFSFEVLLRATDAFDDARLLGAGGFGKVYRGELRDGMTVAIKYSVVQGDAGIEEREFQSELEVICRVHHKHLVSFLGYATEGDKRLLVLQFMPNGTLYDRIHADESLDWAGRLRAAVGAARGLAYLHEDCRPAIIQRNIKSSNVLMDANMDARVADFGISKLKEESYVNTHVSTRVIGTFRYLDPTYASTGRLTAESDTYSFGVILLELVTGRQPSDGRRGAGEESLVAWSRGFIEERGYFGIIDPFLKEIGYDRDEVRRVLKTAWLCTQPSRQDRPTMSQVLRYLEGNARPGSPRRPERDALTMLADEMFMTGR
jgi:serine/threonine protein kinase